MENSIYVASKLSNLNPEKFNDSTIINFNGIDMQKGQFCLYKTMYLLNIFYFLMFGKVVTPKEEWSAWTNGPVNKIVRSSIINKVIFNEDEIEGHELNNDTFNKFVSDINDFFSDLDPEELYEISHYDPAFKQTKKNNEIDIEQFEDYYKTNFLNAISYFRENYGWDL